MPGFRLYTRRHLDERIAHAELAAYDKAVEDLQSARRRDQAVNDALRQTIIRLRSQLGTYAGTLAAQDDTVRLHLARIEHLQRSLTDATTTTAAWAEDRKDQADRIAELKLSLVTAIRRRDFAELAERDALTALGVSRARYGDLEARLAPADAENVGLVQARIRRLIEVLWASRRRIQQTAADLSTILQDHR